MLAEKINLRTIHQISHINKVFILFLMKILDENVQYIFS